MDLAKLTERLGAALQGSGTDADRLLLLLVAGHLLALLAALLIPFAILYFLSQRRDFEFRGVLWSFAAVGLVAALSQALALWGVWRPEDTWLPGSAQAIAAALAFGAALLLWMQLPDAVRLPSMRQLRRANATLTRETWDQQRALQNALTEAALFRGLADDNALGTALLSPAGRWLQVNSRFAEALALSRTELLKRDPLQLLGSGLLDSETAEEERECTVEGQTRWYRWRAVTLPGFGGRGRARLIQCRDISAEKKAEEEIARLRERWEVKQEEWTRTAADWAARLEQALAEKQSSEIELTVRAARLERSAAQLEQLSARLSELAANDLSSGLLSPSALAGRLDLAVSVALRYGRPFSALVIAADPVEEMTPDTVADAVAAVLRAELRDGDAAARCDGDRFCALLLETDATAAGTVADRIRRRIAATPFAIVGGRTLRLTCCTGTAEWKADQGLGEVLSQAAEALRAARAQGRNKSVGGEERGARG